MRSLLVQFSSSSGIPGNWIPFDLFESDFFPPNVRINAAAFQGWVFEGMDRLVSWVEEEDLVVALIHDDLSDWPDNRWARIVRFPPLFQDPSFGGAWNTRPAQTLYAEGSSVDALSVLGPVLPFEDLPEMNGEELSGQWLADVQFELHRASRDSVSWRDWTYGVPEEDLEDGRIRPQRPLGRYDIPTGTRTYFLRDIAEPGGHGADFENLMIRDIPGANEQQSTSVGGNGETSFSFLTETAEPQLLSWPAGDYRVQLDVPAVGADLVFGLLNLGSGVGHFARQSASPDTDLESFPQQENAFQGAGLHLATSGSITWSDFNQDDRFEVSIAVQRVSGHGNQGITLRYSADCFADGPWTGGGAPNPNLRLVSDSELAPSRQSSDAELTSTRQTENAEIV